MERGADDEVPVTRARIILATPSFGVSARHGRLSSVSAGAPGGVVIRPALVDSMEEDLPEFEPPYYGRLPSVSPGAPGGVVIRPPLVDWLALPELVILEIARAADVETRARMTLVWPEAVEVLVESGLLSRFFLLPWPESNVDVAASCELNVTRAMMELMERCRKMYSEENTPRNIGMWLRDLFKRLWNRYDHDKGIDWGFIDSRGNIYTCEDTLTNVINGHEQVRRSRTSNFGATMRMTMRESCLATVSIEVGYNSQRDEYWFIKQLKCIFKPLYDPAYPERQKLYISLVNELDIPIFIRKSGQQLQWCRGSFSINLWWGAGDAPSNPNDFTAAEVQHVRSCIRILEDIALRHGSPPPFLINRGNLCPDPFVLKGILGTYYNLNCPRNNPERI